MGVRERFVAARAEQQRQRSAERAALRSDPARRRAEARRVLLGMGLLLVVAVVIGGVSWVREAPLRADGLPTAQAEVVGRGYHRLRADGTVVRYDVPGRGPVTAEIPVRRVVRRGTVVAVRYDPADPTHARTTENWNPAYDYVPQRVLPLLTVAGGVLAVRRLRGPGRLGR